VSIRTDAPDSAKIKLKKVMLGAADN